LEATSTSGALVIEPSTDTVCLWAKSYLAGGLIGWPNGAYRFHTVDAATLVEPGFPTNIQTMMSCDDLLAELISEEPD
jgi:hypothetical protein